ncbi:MAG TPA: homocysteine S-methyltransferase family protein [Solirubrobacteraceae bacterium]|nr:homocysteine S-methyltransferase family protein [Solirubrobacteraceae bacterium]
MTNDLVLTDGGLETVLVFHEGLDLPEFAAFPLLDTPEGRAHLARYFERFLALAREHGARLHLDTPTWRANADWGARLGYDRDALARVNRDAVAFARELAVTAPDVDVRVEGVVGPRGDGYVVEERMDADAAAAYHAAQVDALAAGGADLVAAITMTYADEAIGIVRAAVAAGVPAIVSFTVETDGRLPDGTALGDAIAAVDAATGGAAEGFLINCAHPTHFADVLGDAGARAGWQARIVGLRANASTRSHAELDVAEELDEGDPSDLAARYVTLADHLPHLTILGGCCGTDQRHVAAIATAWRARHTAAPA